MFGMNVDVSFLTQKRTYSYLLIVVTKAPDGEEDDDTQLILKLMVENTRLTPKLDRFCQRTVGIGVKDLAIKSYKS